MCLVENHTAVSSMFFQTKMMRILIEIKIIAQHFLKLSKSSRNLCKVFVLLLSLPCPSIDSTFAKTKLSWVRFQRTMQGLRKERKNNDNNPVLGTRGSEFNPWNLQNEVFGGAHHYLRAKSDSKNAVASCTMGLLAATETWFFARVFLEWKSSFENGNIDACCHHSLPQTISHSSPFPDFI